VTLLAFGWRHGGHRLRPLLFLGALTLVMVMVSPVCHLHYFCLALPLVTGLIGRAWEARGSMWPGPGLALLLAVNFLVNGLTHLPGTDVTRDLGLAAYATLALWLTAVVILWRTRPRQEREGRLPLLRRAAKVKTWGEVSAA